MPAPGPRRRASSTGVGTRLSKLSESKGVPPPPDTLASWASKQGLSAKALAEMPPLTVQRALSLRLSLSEQAERDSSASQGAPASVGGAILGKFLPVKFP